MEHVPPTHPSLEPDPCEVGPFLIKSEQRAQTMGWLAIFSAPEITFFFWNLKIGWEGSRSERTCYLIQTAWIL